MAPSSKVGKIEQEVIIRGATPHDIYETLLDEKKHAALTSGEAMIRRFVGGKFTTFDGWATGEQVEFVVDKKIVQTWRAEDWPEGEVSECTYELTAVTGGTKIVFTQKGVPKSFVKAVTKGWQDYYWKPLQKEFTKK